MTADIVRGIAALFVVAGCLSFASAESLTGHREADVPTAPLPPVAESTASSALPFLDLRPAAPQQQAATASNRNDNGELFVRLGVWTIIVLCLCVLTVLGIRQWQRGRGMLPITNSNARILETVSLGPNRMISLVALGDVRAIVGCDAAGIRSIVLAPPSFDDEFGNVDTSSSRAANSVVG